MTLTDKQKEEVDKVIYEQVQENLDDLTVFDDYWHALTCSDGTVLEINIYDGYIYGDKDGLQCAVYTMDETIGDMPNFEDSLLIKSKHLDGIDPKTNAQVKVYF